MTAQQTSIEAYQELAFSKIGDRQKCVLLALLEQGALNNRLLARALNWPVNCVTPRINELRKQGYVEEAFINKDYATGKNTIFWRVVCKNNVVNG